ncbi:MAG: tetratricopeptide repeat protein [Candidatus Marinimicrobia bacterium]|nr:tetratricopeptide repeat protein [Candidatus Neomarinimicrobiota bacterium]
MRRTQLKSIIVFLSFWSFCSVSAAIVDTPEATLSPAQREWLLDNPQKAKQLYISEIDTSTRKEVPAFNAAYISYLDGDFPDTEKYLNIALSENPKYGPALFLKGLIEYDRRNLKNSFNSLRKSIKTHPHPELPNYYLGKFLYERKRYDEAIDYLEDAISDFKLYTFSYSLLGQLYIEINKLDKAIEILEKGFVYSHDADIIYYLAKAYELSKQTKNAIKYYGLFAYLYPQHPNYQQAKQFLDNHHITKYWTNRLEPIPERGESARFFPAGEDYVYSIHWGPIRVGELNTKILGSLEYNGIDAYKVQFSMDSNPALEFIATLHSDYITIVDQRTKQTLRHYLHLRENKIIAEKVYDYDRENGIFKCRTVHKDGHIDYLEKYLPRDCIDGTSILFYARQIVSECRTEIVLTTIDETFVQTDIQFNDIKEPIEVRGNSEYAYKISGESHYKGIVGFTGKFRGWFRDCEAHLPVGSDFEIWVGRIRISMASVEEQQLHRYKR